MFLNTIGNWASWAFNHVITTGSNILRRLWPQPYLPRRVRPEAQFRAINPQRPLLQLSPGLHLLASSFSPVATPVPPITPVSPSPITRAPKRRRLSAPRG